MRYFGAQAFEFRTRKVALAVECRLEKVDSRVPGDGANAPGGTGAA